MSQKHTSEISAVRQEKTEKELAMERLLFKMEEIHQDRLSLLEDYNKGIIDSLVMTHGQNYLTGKESVLKAAYRRWELCE